ncbi:hypothetical protein P7C73_g3794, partial [Tremellales sp. Uapishka_1]
MSILETDISLVRRDSGSALEPASAERLPSVADSAIEPTLAVSASSLIESPTIERGLSQNELRDAMLVISARRSPSRHYIPAKKIPFLEDTVENQFERAQSYGGYQFSLAKFSSQCDTFATQFRAAKRWLNQTEDFTPKEFEDYISSQPKESTSAFWSIGRDLCNWEPVRESFKADYEAALAYKDSEIRKKSREQEIVRRYRNALASGQTVLSILEKYDCISREFVPLERLVFDVGYTFPDSYRKIFQGEDGVPERSQKLSGIIISAAHTFARDLSAFEERDVLKGLKPGRGP